MKDASKIRDHYVRGYMYGFEDGKREAVKELQKENKNTDLPSNETLKKIFKLLFDCMERDRKTSSVYMNAYDRYVDYITLNW